MLDVLYLHGFGETHPDSCRVAQALRTALPTTRVLAPCYHPRQQVTATRIAAVLDEFMAIIDQTPSNRVHLAGYSFGGLLAGWLAEQRPELIANVLLLAPAIDNFARNYADRPRSSWRMPGDHVDELRSYSARPSMVRPTTLVHGWLDDDTGGSAPWRIHEWATEQPFRNVYMLSGVGHSLEPWLSAASWNDDKSTNTPTFQQLAAELVTT